MTSVRRRARYAAGGGGSGGFGGLGGGGFVPSAEAWGKLISSCGSGRVRQRRFIGGRPPFAPQWKGRSPNNLPIVMLALLGGVAEFDCSRLMRRGAFSVSIAPSGGSRTGVP